MKQQYLVMYGHSADQSGTTSEWGGIVPDLPGCVSVGSSLEQMRAMMREAVTGHLQTMAADGDPLPLPSATTIDFAEERPENGVDYCVVEYLEVDLPEQIRSQLSQASFAAATPRAQDQGQHG